MWRKIRIRSILCVCVWRIWVNFTRPQCRNSPSQFVKLCLENENGRGHRETTVTLSFIRGRLTQMLVNRRICKVSKTIDFLHSFSHKSIHNHELYSIEHHVLLNPLRLCDVIYLNITLQMQIQFFGPGESLRKIDWMRLEPKQMWELDYLAQDLFKWNMINTKETTPISYKEIKSKSVFFCSDYGRLVQCSQLSTDNHYNGDLNWLILPYRGGRLNKLGGVFKKS